MQSFVTRFAPSPTGELHLGHAYAAIVVWEAARRAGGRLLLRIEDIDQGRCRPEYEQAIYEDLAWLGLQWETPVRRQSERFAFYEAAIADLAERGLLYRCFKTRREILDEIAAAPHKPEATLGAAQDIGTPYVGAALPPDEEQGLLEAGKPFAWRLSMARALEETGALSVRFERLDGSAGESIPARPEQFGDPVLARKDFPASYHLASVLDDADQGVTHVIRGEDLTAAAHLHVLLQALLDLPSPIYRRHKLILGPDGTRLSKRNDAKSIRSHREEGASLTDVYALLGLEWRIDAPPPT
ncbi:MAG: tRNA glutamyl-Q(34) synthetase GluQRS [Pseudomonadota bacterium]